MSAALLSARPTPDVARRAWPGYLAAGAALVVVALAGALWPAGGPWLLLSAVGTFLCVRGGLLVRGARSAEGELAGRMRRLGVVAFVGGLLAAAVAPLPVAGTVLLVAVPVLLLGAGLALLVRDGWSRRGGRALLVWAGLATAVLVATGLGQDWARAADVARVVAGFAVAGIGVALLMAAAALRAVAAAPEPAPAAAGSSGCAGCACAGGGCGSLPRG